MKMEFLCRWLRKALAAFGSLAALVGCGGKQPAQQPPRVARPAAEPALTEARRAKFNELRIYQVMVESFQDGDPERGYGVGWGPSHHRGDLRGIIDALPYIESLNVNALWLTPVFSSQAQGYEANKLDATGYYCHDYFKIDPAFGTFAEAKELVDKAHERGLYVFFDGVFGHYHRAGVAPSPSGLEVVELQPIENGAGERIGGQVKYPESLPFFKEVAQYWVDTLGIDGWRLDQAYQVPVEHWGELRQAVRQAADRRADRGEEWGRLGYMVGEIWKGEREIAEEGYGPADKPGLLSNYDFPLRYALVRALACEENGKTGPASDLNRQLLNNASTYPPHAIPNFMLSNHDVVRFGDLLQRSGFEPGPESEGYWRRHKAALSFLASLTGPVTLYYGDETGDELEGFAEKVGHPDCEEPGHCDDHVSRTSGKIDGLSEQAQGLKAFTAELLAFRAANRPLWDGMRVNLLATETLHADLKEHGGEKVLFVLNAGKETETARFPAETFDGKKIEAVFGGEGQYEAVDETYAVEVPALTGLFLKVAE